MRHIKYIANGLGICLSVYVFDFILSLFCKHVLPHLESDFTFYGSIILFALIVFYIVGWIFSKN